MDKTQPELDQVHKSSQSKAALVYRFIIFPLIVTALSAWAFLVIGPMLQPYIDQLYAPRVKGVEFNNQLKPISPSPSASSQVVPK